MPKSAEAAPEGTGDIRSKDMLFKEHWGQNNETEVVGGAIKDCYCPCGNMYVVRSVGYSSLVK